MKNRDNYFLILGLDYRKKDYTDEEIRSRITEKCQYWNDNCERDKENGDDYKKYIRRFIDIEDTMLDPDSRVKEAADAAYFVGQYLDDAMAVYEGQNTIERKEAERICDGGNIPLELFQELTGKTIIEETELVSSLVNDPNPKPANFQRIKKADRELSRVNRDTLYHFLAGDNKADIRAMQSMSGTRLLEKYSDPIKKQYKNNHTDEATSIRNLCATCEEIFDDTHPEYKASYDAYIIWKKIDTQIKKIIDAAGTDRCLNEAQKELFVKELGKILGSEEAGAGKFDDICRYKNVRYGSGKVIDIDDSDSNEVYKVSSMLKTVRQALDRKKYAEAETLLDTIDAIWPGHEEACSLRMELNNKLAEQQAEQQALSELIFLKKFFEADEFLKMHADTIYHGSEQVKEVLEQCTKLMRQAEDSRSETEVYQIVDDIRRLCIDYPLGNLTRKFKVQPPADCKAEVTRNGSVLLSWSPSPSPGEVTYRVVRKIGSYPQNFKDTDKDMIVSKGCSAEDDDIKSGQTGCYYVFSCREGMYSNPARVKIINIQELSGLTCKAGDGCLTLSWDPVPENANVLIIRKIQDAPISTMDGKRIWNMESPWTDEFLDNDQTYGYRVCLCYEINGKTMITEGMTITAIPRAVPATVRDYTIEPGEKGLYTLRWRSIDRSHTEFYYLEGENCPREEGEIDVVENLEQNDLKVLKPVQKYGYGFSFSVPVGKKYCIIPVVHNEEMVVFGRSSIVWNIPEVTVKRAEVYGSSLELSFSWPEDVNEIMAKYGNARYPVSPEEEGFQSVHINRKQYDSAEKLQIMHVEKEEYYVCLYASVELAGKQTLIDIGHICYNNEPKTIIQYTISVKGLFSNKRAEIRFSCPGMDSFELDDIEIYAKRGSVPYYKNSSTCIMSVPAQRADRNCSIQIPLKDIEKNTYIRPFFKDDRNYERISLEETEHSDPKIK